MLDRTDASFFLFFFNDTATTEIYTLSLHDALPISANDRVSPIRGCAGPPRHGRLRDGDRKSTRLNSSHLYISYAVFCLKKKKYKGRKRQICPSRTQLIVLRTPSSVR